MQKSPLSAIQLLLKLQNLPGDGVHRILVLISAGLEVDLILAAARAVIAGMTVVVVQLHGAAHHGVRRETGVAEGDLLGPGLADVGRSGVPAALHGPGPVDLLLELHHTAVGGADLVVILVPAGEELQLIHLDPVLISSHR